MPNGWSLEGADFVNKCLKRKPGNRLGLNGPAEVKQHIWLRDYDWQALCEKTLEAPYKPQTYNDNFDKNLMNIADKFRGDDPIEMQKQAVLLFRPSI